jgi:hypothetical protein
MQALRRIAPNVLVEAVADDPPAVDVADSAVLAGVSRIR